MSNNNYNLLVLSKESENIVTISSQYNVLACSLLTLSKKRFGLIFSALSSVSSTSDLAHACSFGGSRLNRGGLMV